MHDTKVAYLSLIVIVALIGIAMKRDDLIECYEIYEQQGGPRWIPTDFIEQMISFAQASIVGRDILFGQCNSHIEVMFMWLALLVVAAVLCCVLPSDR